MRLRSVAIQTNRGRSPGVRSGTRGLPERAGVLLTIVDEAGRVAQGEASPLPGYSVETTSEAERALAGISWAAVPEAEPGEPARAFLRRSREALVGLPPSARFAVETAILGLVAERRGVPLFALLRTDGSTPPVPMSAMAGGVDDPEVGRGIARALARGIRTVKLKLRGPDLGAQAGFLSAARTALADADLRLDANGAFSAGATPRVLSELAAFRPELVEEPAPLDVVRELPSSPVPLALDESLSTPGALASIAPRLAALRFRAVVLKPTTLGGISGCLELADEATALGLDVTVSHTFDGPVALAAARHLALAIASRTRASGLDVHAGLAAWPERVLPPLSDGSLVPEDRPGLGLSVLEVP
ncbi:MAG TPA: enolase C-terminal domain-like protein [Polyangiaceae bacterium]|nr:enolase C-terminal domain-like protein [Polyangiaceae bacterium]